MADIKKIKVNGTEYDVQPEWASVNEKEQLLIAPDRNVVIIGTKDANSSQIICIRPNGDLGQSTEPGVHICPGYPDGSVCTWLGGRTKAECLEIGYIQAAYNDTVEVYCDFEFGSPYSSDNPYKLSIGSLVLDKTGIKMGSAKLSGSGNTLTAAADSVFVDAPQTSIGQGDGTVYLYGTVLVNNEPIGDGSVPWADYDSGTKALSIGAQGNLVKIGTTGSCLKLGTGVTGVEIDMGTSCANIFDGQITLTRVSDPYYCIWLGTHDGKISVGDPDEGLDGARVLIGTDSISMGSTANALTIGTDSISMGTGGMSIGPRTLSLGSGVVTAGDVTLDWSGLNGVKLSYDATAGTVTLSAGGKSATIQLS